MTGSDFSSRMALVVGRLYRRMRTVDGTMSNGQLSALAMISTFGPMRLVVLAERELISAPSATRFVAELEKLGYIRRQIDPVDRRAFLVEATELGLEMLQQARTGRTAVMAELLKSLDPSEAALVAAALPALERLAVKA